jgi:uncharacterized protein YgbK (DUF1537 family)
LVDKPLPFVSPGPVEQIIVVSGSASPGTANQISWALENGFTGLRLNPPHLLNPERAKAERAAAVQQALDVLGGGRSVILYTAHGPEDPAIVETRAWLQAQGISPEEGGRRLAEQQGLILRSLLEATGLRRACVAGGDTSSYAAQQLGIYALEMLIPVAPGAPLCRASAHESRFDGLEISLKGGQVGQAPFFGQIRTGRA